MPDSALVLAIKSGEHDADLLALHTAMVQRITHSDVAIRWRVKWQATDDILVEVTEDDLTLGEAQVLERMLSTNWSELSPTTSAKHCASLLIVALMQRHDQTKDDARKLVNAVPMTSILDHIDNYQVDDAPLDTGPSATT